MKNILNGLLALLGLVLAYLVLMQGFAAPQLNQWLDLVLRILAALCLQAAAIRMGKKRWHRLLPLYVTAIFAVLGFFLLLTSPSWRHATVGGYLMDYFSPAAACALVCFLWKVGPKLKNL